VLPWQTPLIVVIGSVWGDEILRFRMNAVRIALNIGSLVLVAVLGWLLVRIGLGVFQPKSLYVPEPIIAPSTATDSSTRLAAYDFSSDPFSFGEIIIDPLELIIDEDAPETTLDLKLKGIISEGTATFQMPDGKDKAVKIGEEVMNGVTLTRTAKDFVTLDVNGEPQKLTRASVKSGEASKTKIIVSAEPETTPKSRRSAKTKATQPTKASLEALLTKVQLTPDVELLPDRSTRVRGLKINAKSGADLAPFKLKPGDVLTRVGPVVLNSRSPKIKELRDLLTSGAAQDVDVIRNGAPITIRIGQ